MSLDRRSFLAGSAAALALAACGDGNDAAPTTTISRAANTPPESQLQVAQLFSNDRVVGALPDQRVPFALIAPDGPLRGGDAAARLTLLSASGEVVNETMVAARVAAHTHDDDGDHDHPDAFRYYAPRLNFATAGRHNLIIEAPEGDGVLPIEVFPPAELALPHRGMAFPSLTTPTVDEAAGVDTLCTRDPWCPFHATSVHEALAAGEPFVALIATPAFCQTQFCGPVLDVLIEQSPTITAIHVEVWANPAEVGGNLADEAIRPAPAIVDLGLTFEPALFVVGADGLVAERLDNIFDGDELADALASA